MKKLLLVLVATSGVAACDVTKGLVKQPLKCDNILVPGDSFLVPHRYELDFKASFGTLKYFFAQGHCATLFDSLDIQGIKRP